MSWLRFVGTRVAASCVLLVVLLSAVFGMSVVLIPGDFATMYRLSMRAEDVELIRVEMGSVRHDGGSSSPPASAAAKQRNTEKKAATEHPRDECQPLMGTTSGSVRVAG